MLIACDVTHDFVSVRVAMCMLLAFVVVVDVHEQHHST